MDSVVFRPTDLKCEYAVDAFGVDVEQPGLGWRIGTNDTAPRSVHQSAYRILVASAPERLKRDDGDAWDSGKVNTDRMGGIPYSGLPLQSSRKYWWKVKVWDHRDDESVWSETAFWVMGILAHHEWKARWISARGAEKYALRYEWSMKDFDKKNIYAEPQPDAPAENDPNYSSMLLRREFDARPDAALAILHISGLGHYEVNVNGRRVGDRLLAPGWTKYNKTVLYDTYDVTRFLRSGANAIGILLGNGMYNIQPDTERYVKFINTFGPLKAVAQLHLHYADGSTRVIGTDSTWHVFPGPITFSNVFAGEDYDANREPDGWKMPGFTRGDAWTHARETQGPGGELRGLSCASAPVTAIETLVPVAISRIRHDAWVYDLGQNASVMPKISMRGPRGSSVRVIPGELLTSDGTVDRRSVTQDGDGTLGETAATHNLTRSAWWQYTLAGNETEHWFPKFFYHGARYFQVELSPAEDTGDVPVIEELHGVVVHASCTPIGTFSCSNELFNRIHSLVRWAQRSNLMSVLTDCPHRERLSWLEQYHLNGPSLRYNFDMTPVFRKAMNDMADSQLENGFIPNIAPEYFIAGSPELTNGFRNSPEWGSAFIIVAWQQYLFTGDSSLMRLHYQAMKRYLSFLRSSAHKHIIVTGLGDWYDIGPNEPWGSQLTPESLTATAIYYYDTWIMAQAAEVLGHDDDARLYDILAGEIRDAFNAEFYDPEARHYASNSQTSNAIPVALNIVEPRNRRSVAQAIVDDVRSRGNALTSGDVGYRFLLMALAAEGYSDVIYDMNNQSERPGYGFQLKMGATSLTEKWDAGVGYLGSQNHFMLGQINEWFFNCLVGIGVPPGGAGFRTSIIRPMLVGDLEWVKGSLDTISGKIIVECRKNGCRFSLDLVIPANTSAVVYIPARSADCVTEGGQPAMTADGMQFSGMEGDRAVFHVGSGRYMITSTTDAPPLS